MRAFAKLSRIVRSCLDPVGISRTSVLAAAEVSTMDRSPVYPIMEGTESVEWGRDVHVVPPFNVYGCHVGDECRIGPFVEIQRGVRIGNRVKIGSHTFVCAGVRIEDDVFVGHGVVFTNDRQPRSTTPEGALKGPKDWHLERTLVERGASLGSGVMVLPGITIGRHAMIGAGAVVTRDVEPGAVVAGNPARRVR